MELFFRLANAAALRRRSNFARLIEPMPGATDTAAWGVHDRTLSDKTLVDRYGRVDAFLELAAGG